MSLRTKPLVVFSHGMGQDSGALLALLLDSPRTLWKQIVADGDLVVIHSDTGNEHDTAPPGAMDTISYRTWTRDFCNSHGVEYVQIEVTDGYHPGAWAGGLLGQYRANNTIGSVGFPSTCSDALKVQPIWNYTNARLARELDVDPARRGGLYAHRNIFGPIHTLIALAADELDRIPASSQLELIPKQQRDPRPWYTRCVKTIYPLVDLGVTRLRAHSIFRERDLPLPRPSNCKACFWKSHQEILHLERTDPTALKTWLDLEETKLTTWAPRCAAKGVRNAGVKGSRTLREYLEEAHRKYGHLSLVQLDDYIMSHGHCVGSKWK